MSLATLRLLSLFAALACAAPPCFTQTRQTKQDAAARTPKNEALRRELLKMLEADQALRRGEVVPDAVANLTDIILHDHLHKPQLYGTRFDIEGGRLVLKNVKEPRTSKSADASSASCL